MRFVAGRRVAKSLCKSGLVILALGAPLTIIRRQNDGWFLDTARDDAGGKARRGGAIRSVGEDAMADILPGPPVATGKWDTLGGGHVLVPMYDGNVIDWYYDEWRLLTYMPNNNKNNLPY